MFKVYKQLIDLPNMIGSFAAGTPNPLLDKYYALFMNIN